VNTTAVLRIARKHRIRTGKSSPTLGRRILGAGIAALLATVAATSQAATQLWLGLGADGNWTTSGNFSPGAPFTGTEDFQFDGNNYLTTNYRDATLNGNSLTFNVGAGAFTLNGTMGLTLQAGGVANLSSNLQTIGFLLAPQKTQTWDAGTAGLHMTGPVFVILGSGPPAVGSVAITVTGAGDTTIDGRIVENHSGGFQPGVPHAQGSLIKNGTGTLTLTNTGIPIPLATFGGGTTLNSGTVSFADGMLGSTGLVDFAGSATLQWYGTNTQDISARLKLEDGVNAGFDTNGNNVTFANALQTGESQSAALTKLGEGTLTLGGTNTYKGGTTIEGGRIFVTTDGALGTGGITFFGGELVAYSVSALMPFSSAKSIEIADGATGRISNGSGVGTQVTFSGGITLGVGSTLAIGSAGNTGTIVLSGIGNTNANTFVRVDAGTLQNGDVHGFTQYTSVAETTTVAAGATLDAGGFDSRILNLQGAGVLLSGTTYSVPVLLLSSAPDSDGSNPPSAPSLVFINPFVHTPVTYAITRGSFSGAINDGNHVVALVKDGTETDVLTLSGVSHFTGGTEIQAGTLSFANGSLGTMGDVFFSGTSTLRWEPGNVQDLSPRMVLGNGINATFDTNGNNVTFANAFSFGSEGDGSAGITKAGAGTLTMVAANSYTGGTTLKQGVLSFANDALGTTGTVDFAGDSALRWETGNTQDLSGRLKIEDGVNATLDTNNNNITLANAIQLGQTGTGALTKAGAGVLTLLGDNTYTGGTTILPVVSTGILALGLTNFNSALQLGNGGTTGSIVGNVTDNATLIFNRSDDISFPGIISGTGTVTKEGAGKLTIVQPNTYTGGTTVAAGTLFLGDGFTPGASLGTGDVRVSANATFQLDLALNETFANNIVNTGHVVADDGPVSNYTISGLITGTGDFTKTGGNTVTLSHVNDYTGNTYVNQGTLLAGVGTPGGPGASGPGPFGQNSAVFVNSGGTLQLNGFNVSIAALLGSPGGIVQNSSLTPATLTLAGPFNVGYFDGIIQNGDFPFGTAIALSEPLSDAAPILTPIPGAPLSLWMAGSGFQTLAGLNTYTGTTHVTNGTLRAGISNPGGGPGAFGNNSAVTVSDSGILETTGHTVAIGSLAGNAGGIVENGAFQPGNLITGANNSSTTFAGLIRDGVFEIFQGTLVTSLSFESQTQFAPTTPAPLSITKTGTGTQILSGANTYTGGTTLREGTLAAGNAKAFGNGNLTMTGGTLMTTGGPLAVNIGAGNILFTGGTFVANVGGLLPAVQHDQLVTTGTANISGGMLTLLQQNGFVLKAGNQIVLLSAAGGVAGGTATGVAVPASQVTGLSAFSNTALLIPVVNLYTTSVILEALQGSFAGLSGFLGMTPNEIAVATALDSLVAKIGGKTGVIKELDFLDGQSFTQLLADLDKISPEELTSIFHLAKSLANVQTANIQRRLEELRSENPEAFAALGRLGGAGASGPVGKRSKAVAPAEDERWGLWFAGSGEFTQVGNRTNAAGFSLDSSGVTAGVDYRFTDHFAAGISLGYMNTTASLSNGGKIDADGGRVGAYATYFDRGFYIDAAVSGGANGYSTRRTTPNNTVATASPQGTEVNLLLATGYDWKWKGLTIGPIASFQYTNVQLNGFTETGGFAPLSVLTQNADSARTALGFHATFDKKVGRAIIRPEVRAAWQHEFGDTSYSLTSSFATLGGSAFTVAGPETGRDSLLIGAGLSVLFNDRFSIYAYYDGELLRANYSSHNISAGFRYRF
jgi:autotransporter-associated beta strand protein